MWCWFIRLRPRAEFLALEATAAHAGFALACCYSGADEYEASVIAARRVALAGRSRRRAWLTGIATVVMFGIAIAV